MSPNQGATTRRYVALAGSCGVVAAAAVAHLTRNHWVTVPLEHVLTICFAAPAGVLLLAAFVGMRLRFLPPRFGQSSLGELRKVCFGLSIFVAAVWLELPLRTALTWYDRQKAREFCELLRPAIERYRVDHADYPNDISWLLLEQANGKAPKLIENGFQYHHHGRSFMLAFIAADQPFAWHVFDSSRGTWDIAVD